MGPILELSRVVLAVDRTSLTTIPVPSPEGGRLEANSPRASTTGRCGGCCRRREARARPSRRRFADSPSAGRPRGWSAHRRAVGPPPAHEFQVPAKERVRRSRVRVAARAPGAQGRNGRRSIEPGGMACVLFSFVVATNPHPGRRRRAPPRQGRLGAAESERLERRRARDRRRGICRVARGPRCATATKSC
jgi:hypothetical protein